MLTIRLFEDDVSGPDGGVCKRWHRNVQEKSYEILCVSQFTLYSKLKGNKPDFHLAMQGPEAIHLYNMLLSKIREIYGEPDRVKGNNNLKSFAHI